MHEADFLRFSYTNVSKSSTFCVVAVFRLLSIQSFRITFWFACMCVQLGLEPKLTLVVHSISSYRNQNYRGWRLIQVLVILIACAKHHEGLIVSCMWFLKSDTYRRCCWNHIRTPWSFYRCPMFLSLWLKSYTYAVVILPPTDVSISVVKIRYVRRAHFTAGRCFCHCGWNQMRTPLSFYRRPMFLWLLFKSNTCAVVILPPPNVFVVVVEIRYVRCCHFTAA